MTKLINFWFHQIFNAIIFIFYFGISNKLQNSWYYSLTSIPTSIYIFGFTLLISYSFHSHLITNYEGTILVIVLDRASTKGPITIGLNPRSNWTLTSPTGAWESRPNGYDSHDYVTVERYDVPYNGFCTSSLYKGSLHNPQKYDSFKPLTIFSCSCWFEYRSVYRYTPRLQTYKTTALGIIVMIRYDQ